ncbi:unnamed protein product [Peniophora sp. CBMAI 1063]|nr:unnamed protein product [Peniophora sp. CBMAI 1063]
MRENKRFEGQYMEKVWFAEEHVRRARKLETVVDDERAADWHRAFDGQHHPHLQSLAIHQYSIFLSASRLKIDAPNLTSAVLKNTVPIFISPLRMLQKLVLHLEEGFMIRGDAPVLNILRTTPLLSHLDLKLQVVSNSVIDEVNTSDAPVALEHLRKVDIQLQGSVDNALLMPSIQAPETTVVRSALLSNCARQNDLLGALPQLRCECCNLVNLAVDSLFAFSTSSTRVKERANGHVTFVQVSGDINTPLTLIPNFTINAHINALVARFQAPYDVARSAPALTSFFRAYSSVTILRLDTDAQTNRALYHLLAENAKAVRSDSDGFLFPALDTLSVVRSSKLYMDSLELVKAHWDAVVDLLEARAVIRRRVRVLSLWGEWAWRRSLDAESLRVIEERAIDLASIYVDEVDDCRDDLD